MPNKQIPLTYFVFSSSTSSLQLLAAWQTRWHVAVARIASLNRFMAKMGELDEWIPINIHMENNMNNHLRNGRPHWERDVAAIYIRSQTRRSINPWQSPDWHPAPQPPRAYGVHGLNALNGIATNCLVLSSCIFIERASLRNSWFAVDLGDQPGVTGYHWAHTERTQQAHTEHPYPLGYSKCIRSIPHYTDVMNNIEKRRQIAYLSFTLCSCMTLTW